MTRSSTVSQEHFVNVCCTQTSLHFLRRRTRARAAKGVWRVKLERFAQGYHAFASHLAKPGDFETKKTHCFAVYFVYETSLQTAHQLHYEERKTGNQMNLSNGTLDPAIEAKNTHTYLIYIRGGYEQFFSTGYFCRINFHRDFTIHTFFPFKKHLKITSLK